jgi:hypothetical protein
MSAGIRWYDYDPTKLLIELSYFLGLAYDLKHPPENEIQKARYQVCMTFGLELLVHVDGKELEPVEKSRTFSKQPCLPHIQVQEGKLTSLKQSIAWPDPEAVTNQISMDEYKAAKKEGKIWVALKGRYASTGFICAVIYMLLMIP